MRKFMRFRIRRGFAMIFVILIALAMIIPVLILASSTIPRRTAVTGEAISDRVLAVGDATVDKILSQINTFTDIIFTSDTLDQGFDNIDTYYSNNPPTDIFEVKVVAVKYAIAHLLSTLNGGTAYQPTPTQDPAANIQADYNYYIDVPSILPQSIWDIEDNVSTYLYDMENQEYYAVWDTANNNIASINSTGISGDIITKPIKNLATGEIKTGIAAWDPNYATDNRWVEIDTNTQYVDNGLNQPQSTKFQIRVSAYPISNSYAIYIARNILAEATLQLKADASSTNIPYTPGSGPFRYATWSGKGLKLDGGKITISAGDRNSDGSYTPTDGGDIYADGNIYMNGGASIGGDVITSGDPGSIIINGTPDIKGSEVYNQTEKLPDFPTGTEDSVIQTSLKDFGPFIGDFNASNSNIFVNGSGVKYYIDDIDRKVNISNSTIYFSPLVNVDPDSPMVDWYINGDLTLDGTTLDFGTTPGIIWVNGDIVFKSSTNITGYGTIVANGSVTFQGNSVSLGYTDANSKIAVISEGAGDDGGITFNGDQTFDGIFYAPHSNIILNGTGKIFGTVVAGGYIASSKNGITLNGAKHTIIYDTSLGEGGNFPPLPGSFEVIAGVEFNSSTMYRLSWKEIITNSVTNPNISELNPEFIYGE